MDGKESLNKFVQLKRVSILIPIRNEARYIQRCLESIVVQTYPSEFLDVWVMDGFSQDGTRAIVQSFVDRYPWIHLLDNPEQTVPHAMNRGLAACSGEIIVRIDGHCEIAPDYIQQCVDTLEQVDATCVGGPLENRGETYMASAIALGMSSPFGVGNALFRYSREAAFVDTLAFGAYRRDIFNTIGYFDPDLVRNQDDEFNYRLRASGGKIYMTPTIRSVYYTRSNLKNLWRQYFQYGFWKTRVLKKHPGSLMIRHLVPGLFVFSLFVSSLGVLFFSWGSWLLLGIVVPYGMANLGFSGYQARQQWRYFPALLVIFPVLHLSYGLGFWWGTLLTMNDA